MFSLSLQRELLVHRQRVEPARGGEGAVDQRLVDAVAGGIEEADMLAGMADLRREPLQRTRLAGEIRAEIDDRDLRRRRGVSLTPCSLNRFIVASPD